MFDETPVFRKVIVPWYDTDVACILLLIFQVAVFLFACCGISVASEMPNNHHYIWVPSFLLIISAVGILSISYRLIGRNAYKFKY
jgi:hypothetical protein